MAKQWRYTDAEGQQVGLMICTACREKIGAGKYRFRETDDAYLPQHRACSEDDPEWARIAKREAERADYFARRKAALIEFMIKFGIPDEDDIAEASSCLTPQDARAGGAE